LKNVKNARTWKVIEEKETPDSIRAQGGRSRTYRAPGRVNLIGEHTDYNDGFVLPAAIDFSTAVTISPRDDRIIKASSSNFSERITFDLDEPSPKPRRHWSDYVRGVAVTLEQAGYRLRGAELQIDSNVPIGAGLSSSAAIEVATGYALLQQSGFDIGGVELARLCQRAENNFVGMRCGIMDQFVACHGQKDRALLLDCRSLEYRPVPLPQKFRLVICNTMIKHELAAGEYNKRRAECEAGLQLLASARDGVSALRDVTLPQLESTRPEMLEVVYNRCRHVVSENVRVQEAVAALERGDIAEMGRLMGESHRSLRDDYQVSCDELDLMVQLAADLPGVMGARMTGGGFGGCTINLVADEAIEEFERQIKRNYEIKTGIAPEVYVCTAADGVKEITSEST
jgi:galactokinase